MVENISFLFGAGISIPMNMPKTSEITEQILKGNNIVRHTNSRYYFINRNKTKNEDFYYDKYIKNVLSLLNKIYDYCNTRYRRPINYEDIFYMVFQIYEDLSLNYDNPIVYPFMEKINIDSMCEELNAGELFRESVRYIKDVVRNMLNDRIKKEELEEFQFIKKIISNYNTDIYTLNHDVLLEQWLNINDINFIDGFEKLKNKIHYWEPELFNNKSGLRLFKLHGSVNWVRFIAEYSYDIFGIPTEDYFNDPTHPYFLQDYLLLTGVHNKMLEYTSSLYTTLFCNFWNSLEETDIMIVSGYSFGDKGINSRIIHWLNNNTAKMIIIHPNLNYLKKSSRGAINNNWDSWVFNNKVEVVEKKVQEVLWSDIEKYLK